MLDKRKLFCGGSRYFCFIKVIIFVKFELFLIIRENIFCFVIIWFFINCNVWSFILFREGKCFVILYNFVKLYVLSGKVMGLLYLFCFLRRGWRKLFLRFFWINCEELFKISFLICKKKILNILNGYWY